MSARVLVVDDSLTVRMDLRDAFEDAGLQAVACSSVAEARRALGEAPFDVIVLDVLLPDGDGIALLDEIRRTELNAGARVMLLSTEAEVRDRIRGLTRGADEYVGKPYDLGYVVARAKELVGPADEPRDRRRSVLVIDDDQGFRERLAETLERAGYRALGASTGEEGLHVAAEARPDAVIVDAVLPGIEGAAVVRRMKLDPGLRHIPMLVLTGWNRMEDEVEALESGADAFARKEGGAEAILARLAVMLRGVERPAETLPPSALGPKKILAVDDSPTYLEEISSHLRREGYEVITARSGEEALELLGVQRVDCVLLDILMPGLSGHDTARRIRARAECRDLPIIMLTTLDEGRALVEGINSGADDFVTKSSDLAVVGARVRAHLRRRQVEEENRLGREQLLRHEAANKLLTAVQEEKERLSALVSSITDEIWFADTQRRFTLVNPAAHSEFRLRGEAVDVEDLAASLEVFRADGSPRPIEEAPPLRALAGEVVRNSEEIIRTPGHGDPRIREVSSSPVKDAGGHIVGSVSVVRDVTEQKRAEERIRRQNAVLAGIARIFRDALSSETEEELGRTCLAVAEDVTQSKLSFLSEINRETGRLDDVSISEMGWEACRMRDRSGHDGKLPVGLEAHGLYRRVLEDGRGFFTNEPSSHPDSIGTSPDHPPLTAFLGVPLLLDGKTVGMVGLGNREGGYGPEELEIAEALAPAIVQAFLSKRAEKALRQADRRKDEFLGMLSHELRNPLAPINNSLYVLEHAPPGGDRALQAQGIIRRQTEHLTRLVDDLLDVTRIARGKIEIHPARVDVCEVVRGACHDHEVLFQDRGLELRLETSEATWIDADGTRITQVIGNLLQNAARFSRPDGKVTVSVGAVDGQARIRVQDDGIGIPREFLALVFEPFVQADRELARTKGGLGLGLALVKGLVELHGGAVSAHSEGQGRGSEFLVTLPLAAGPALSAPAPLRAVEARRLSVLVIEDNMDEATSLRAALEVAGHRVEIARDGPEGLETARALRPDVVLCDIGLPGKDGYEVARTLRGDPALAATRLVAVTGYARPEDVRAAREAGFDHHVAKPASMAELERAMSRPPAGREVAGVDPAAPPSLPSPLRGEGQGGGRERARGKAEVAPALDLEALVSRASHDLRAPLRHIDAFSAALLQQRGAELGEVGRQQVSRIQRARTRAQELIDDLLTLWQVASAKLTMTDVDMTALARQVLADLRQAEAGRVVDVRLEEGVTAKGDARLLQALLRHLLGNAWKFTSKRPGARIEFGRAATTPTGAVYFVRDDGEGFEMAGAGKLFEPFERLHSKDQFEGTGLGLHIVRRVVERHGGRAWIESAPGRGTTVRFTLGAARDDSAATAPRGGDHGELPAQAG